MDIATLIGLVFGLGVIGAAIATGGDMGLFINIPGILIVMGGTLAATLVKFRLATVMKAFMLGAKTAFGEHSNDPMEIYSQAMDMAKRARTKGLLALQEVPVKNDLFKQGVRLAVDGHELAAIRNIMQQEINRMLRDQEMGESMFRGIGDAAPAFGMIGTLVGLVQMLANLEDPASIGPAMAVAMLTTFYGALIANLIAIPIADKLADKTKQDLVVNELIFESVSIIQQRQSPQILAETVSAFLPAGAIIAEADDGGGGEG